MKLLSFLFVFSVCSFGQAISNQWYVADISGNASNSELQCYKPANVAVSGGTLQITAKSQSVTCGNQVAGLSAYSYTSGFMITNTFSFLYGTVSFDMASTTGSGPWPAVWMQGTNCQGQNKLALIAGGTSPCQWPAAGSDEVDITEILGGSATNINQQIHSAGHNDQCTATVASTAAKHHYDFVWAAGSMIWKVDNVTTCTITQSYVPSSAMFLMINLAMGGGGGTVTATLPQVLTIYPITVTQGATTVFNEQWTGTGAQPSVYVGQSFAGSNPSGLDCADSFGVLNNVQTSWINDPGYWTNGMIGPGTTLHLCGNITTSMLAQGSGTSASPVTAHFESGSCGTFSANGNSFINITGTACGGAAALGNVFLGGSVLIQ